MITSCSVSMDDFVEFRRTGDRELREQIVAGTAGLAYWAARRFAGRGEELADLQQVALLALVKAVYEFDPEFGYAFSTFAVPKIVGELKRHFRDRAWTVRPSRGVHDRALELAALASSLTHELRRSPTAAELAQESGYSERAVLEAMDALMVCRDHDDAAGWSHEIHTAEFDRGLEDIENRATVAKLLQRLPDCQREMITLRFFGDQAQSTIARRFGVSQMQVSRLLAQSIAELRRIVSIEDGGHPTS